MQKQAEHRRERPLRGSAGQQPQDARPRASHPRLQSGPFSQKTQTPAHSEGHRLAMQQLIGEAAPGFERMAKSVTEIKQRTLAGLTLVARNDAGLATATHRDGVLACGAAGKDVLPVFLEPGEERSITE